MQVQRIGSTNNKQTKVQNKPSFGMKFYVDEALVNNIRKSMDTITEETTNSKIKFVVGKRVKEFLEWFPKNVAIHNADSKNHELFKDEIKIKNITVQAYRDLIADGKGNIIEDLSTLEKNVNEHELRVASAWETKSVSFVVQTENGVTHRSEDNYDLNNFVKKIQNTEIQYKESKNPDLYLDMIQPPKG